MPEASDVNWEDPCARADALRKAYFSLIQGTNAYEVTYQANGVTRTVRYSVIDTKQLLSELRTAEAECAELTGGASPRRRYPMQLGARRSVPGGWPEEST
jgi:hypothetical protein